MGSAVLTNALATQVSQPFPTTNFNTNILLGSRNAASTDAIAYIYFARPFPLKATILTAELVFYTTAMATGTHSIDVTRLGVKFDASRMTWNSRPVVSIGAARTVTKTGVVADRTEWRVNVADWLQSVSDGGAWYGFKVQTQEAVARYIYSEIHPLSAYRPRLEVTWSDAPNTPNGLAPSGGRAVGIAKPVLRAAYVDVSGVTTLQAVQVQINATDVWTAPTFDSGRVLTSVPELDLAATAYAGLADGATTFWRVRFQDASGLWSPWSLATTFKRDNKGTLVVDSPPVGTPKVEDATPPILWTFTGETQAFYQVWIEHTENGVLVTDWTSTKVQTAVDDVTVPAGKITDPGVTYKLTVRVWDGKQRETTPGDPIYSEVVRYFTFVPGATAGTTGLTADTPTQDYRAEMVTNPILKDGLTHWAVSGYGGPVLSRLATGGPGDQVATFARVTWASLATGTGGFFVQSTDPLFVTTPGERESASVWVRSSKEQRLTLYVQYLNSSGASVLSTNAPAVVVAANVWTELRLNQVSAAPAGAAKFHVLVYNYPGTGYSAWTTGDTLDATMLSVTGGGVAQPYVDPALLGPSPKVVLTWQRATAPDKFNVLRNGKVIASGLSPDTAPTGVFVSGTTYSWTDHTPSPGRPLVYTVQAVVNNVASATNTAATVTVRSRGIWLREPISGLELCILGRDDRPFELDEQVALLHSIAADSNPVAINQSLGGLTGRIEGTLEDYAGLTAQQWRDIYIQIRNLRVRKLYLTTGDYTFEVVAQEWTYEQRTLPQPRFRVGFRFYQQSKILSILLGS